MAGGGFRSPLFIVGWPTAEFGAMGLEGAVKLGFRKELDQIKDSQEKKSMYDFLVKQAYERGSALNVATIFEIDDVIDPVDSRKWITNILGRFPSVVGNFSKIRPQIDTW